MRIFLLGMMGSGKTTLGREMAQQLGYTFLDLDEYIERRERNTIAGIFKEYGEDTFRRLERAALEAAVQENTHAVIATGGGAPCFFDNINYMNFHGETIFLAVSPEQIASRLLATDLSLRPLLASKSQDQIKLFLGTTLAHRIQFYEQAKHIVEGDAITVTHLMRLFNHN